jgi:uncharacterized membrane protein
MIKRQPIAFHFFIIPLCLLVLLLEANLRYASLSSNIFDLGLFFTNHFNFQSEYQRGLSGHVQALFPFFAFAYNSLPLPLAPSFLVLSQGIILSISVVLVWHFFGFPTGLAMALYYPVWVVGLFDFHFDCLVVLILVVFFIFTERQKFCCAAAAASLLVFIKEPFALEAAFCGVYLYLLAFRASNRGCRIKLISCGTLLGVWGFSLFYLQVHWLLPYFGGTEAGALEGPAFAWLGSNLSEIFWNLVSQPGRILQDIIFTPGKNKYLLVVFGLLGFIPLLSPAPLIVAAPILMISMVSHVVNHYDYATHYTAGLIVPVLIAFRGGFAVARAKCTAAFATQAPLHSIMLVVLLGGHWAFASSPISRLFWSDKVWSYSWRAYVPTQREETMKSAMLEYVPADPGVSVSSQNTVNWGHLAHRKVYMPFPIGVIDPHKVIDFSNRDLTGLWRYVRTGYKSEVITRDTYADYVVLDLKRPWFIIDSGCDWLYGACKNEKKAAEFLNLVASALQRYDAIYSLDGFMILRRRL